MRITKLTEPQLEEAAALLARAFFDSPVWTWVVPDETQRRTAMAWFMSAAVRYGMLGGEAYGAGAPLRGVATACIYTRLSCAEGRIPPRPVH